jgi:hypothetical protein
MESEMSTFSEIQKVGIDLVTTPFWLMFVSLCADQ